MKGTQNILKFSLLLWNPHCWKSYFAGFTFIQVYETLPGGNRARHMTVVSPPGLVFDFQRQLSPFSTLAKTDLWKSYHLQFVNFHIWICLKISYKTGLLFFTYLTKIMFQVILEIKKLECQNFSYSRRQKLFHITRWQLFPLSIFVGSVEKKAFGNAH